LTMDGRAPKRLTVEQKAEIEDNLAIIDLRDDEKDLFTKLRNEFGTVSKGKGTPDHKDYETIRRKIKNEKKKLETQKLSDVRTVFFKTISTQDIEEQGRIGFEAFVNRRESEQKTKTVAYTFQERNTLATILPQTDEMTDEEHIKRRLTAMNALIKLCKLREDPRRVLKVTPPARPALKRKFEPELKDLTQSRCIFCLFGSSSAALLPEQSRMFSYARLDVLQKHVESHLDFLSYEDPVTCPCCRKKSDSLNHFLNHCARDHKYKAARQIYMTQRNLKRECWTLQDRKPKFGWLVNISV
jgi:hypothetical protein